MEPAIEWPNETPEDLEDRLRALEPALLDELKSAATDIGVRIRGAAQENAPVDRARLQSSLEYSVRQIGTDLVRLAVGTNLDYAEPMETGTDPFFPPPSELRGWAERVLGDADAAYPVARSIAESGIEERRYLRDGLEENLEWALDRIAEAVRNAFEEVGFA